MFRIPIVYQFKCSDINATYVGQTGLQFNLRISNHMGLSHRTGRHFPRPEHSGPLTHAQRKSHLVSQENSSILKKTLGTLDRGFRGTVHHETETAT